MRNYLVLLGLLLFHRFLKAKFEMKYDWSLSGYWSGAMVSGGNSVQNMTDEVMEHSDSLIIGVSIPVKACYPPKTSRHELTAEILIILDTFYSREEMILYTNYIVNEL